FESNPWGLNDLHGSVAEWTADWYGTYSDRAISDPRGPSSGETRVVRGGSWLTGADGARCAARARHAPGDRASGLGFRLAAESVNYRVAGSRPPYGFQRT